MLVWGDELCRPSKFTSEIVGFWVSKLESNEIDEPDDCADAGGVDGAEFNGATTGICIASFDGFNSSYKVRSRLIEDIVGMRVDANWVRAGAGVFDGVFFSDGATKDFCVLELNVDE